MKFPYGISDFKKIITQGYFYCDRTGKIPELEKSDSQLFIRPRRFGKSLVLSMLENYYDVANKKSFNDLFGNLAIGKNPTSLCCSYFILKFDFSCVDPTGSAKDIQRSLFDHMNGQISMFFNDYYKRFKIKKIEIDRNNALFSMKSLLNSVRETPWSVYLLIDEYDNFANTAMMRAKTEEQKYQALVHNEGPLRTFFKAVKASTSSTMFDRVFITGVSPVVMSDITSGYNIAENIYFEPEFNDLCGFTQEEVNAVVNDIADSCKLDKSTANQAMGLMKTYYNGYSFSPLSSELVYNPTLALYFLKQFEKSCTFPRKMLDANLAVDDEKLEYISMVSGDNSILMELMKENNTTTIPDIIDRFGIKDLLTDKSHDKHFLISYLYYFGVVTLAGETRELKLILKIPNLVIKGLYAQRMEKIFLPEPQERDQSRDAASLVYSEGNIKPLCSVIEKTFFKVFSNRDYRWANELTVKTAFLTSLYNDIIYIMDSEIEIDRRFADLAMIIRPDKRHAKVFDILIEFKFVSLKQTGLNADKVKKLSADELYTLAPVKKNLDDGAKQVVDYANILEKRYQNLRLKKFVVVSLGFERICFKAIKS